MVMLHSIKSSPQFPWIPVIRSYVNSNRTLSVGVQVSKQKTNLCTDEEIDEHTKILPDL